MVSAVSTLSAPVPVLPFSKFPDLAYDRITTEAPRGQAPYILSTYACLARHLNRRVGGAWPSTRRIAAELGVARQTVLDALRWLAEHGLITITPRRSLDGRRHTSHFYRLVGVVHGVDHLRPGLNDAPEEVVYPVDQKQINDVEPEIDDSRDRKHSIYVIYSAKTDVPLIAADVHDEIAEVPGEPAPASVTREEGRPVAPPAPAARRRFDRERAVIRQYIADVAREMNDEASITASTTRAMRIYRLSKLPRDAFLDRILAAREITLEHAPTVRKQRGDDPWRKNRMPYFFGVLEDILGLRKAAGP